jgi:Fur family transcriptional regulator, ferric uptake regulator
MQTFNSSAVLAECRLRPTFARLCILDLFREGQTYTPEQVYRVLVQRGEALSLATTYRVLAQFVEVGLLHRQQLDNGPGRYFLPKPESDRHLLCTECGTMLPLPGPEIDDALRQLAAKHGYLLAEYGLMLQGKCAACARKNRKAALRRA